MEININTKNDHTSKKHSKEMRTIKRRQTEANARRKVAKNWEHIANSRAYRQAAAQEICRHTTCHLIDELYDGILLELNERNCNRSHSIQKRLLRRIVEKRQAQAIHQKIKRSVDGFSRHLHRCSLYSSMKQIHRHQCCALT